jgi:hypothetical protein
LFKTRPESVAGACGVRRSRPCALLLPDAALLLLAELLLAWLWPRHNQIASTAMTTTATAATTFLRTRRY